MRTLAKNLIPMLLATALAATARAEGGYLGVTVNDADGGIQILTVRDASAAASAGMKSGDVVQAIGETKITNLDDFQKQLAKLSAGDKITLKVKRGEANETVEVTLGKRPGESVAVATTPVSNEPKAAHSANAIPATPLIAAPAEPAPAQVAPAAPAPPAKASGSIASIKAAPGGAGFAGSVATAAPPRKGGFLGVTLGSGEGGDGADNTISSVVDGGPAAKAGISNGDQIVSIDGKNVSGASDISSYLATKQPGDSVEITVMRDGKRKLRTATLADYGKIGFAAGAGGSGIQLAAPAEMPAKASDNEKPKTAAGGMRAKRAEAAEKTVPPKKSGGRGWLGVMLEGNDGAPIVSQPTENSPAANAGIKAGDAIIKVGDKEIESTEDLLAALEGKAGQDVAVVVKRGGSTKKFGITLGDVPAEHAVAEANEPNESMPKAASKAKVEAEVKAARDAAERGRKEASEEAAKTKKMVAEQVAKARAEASRAREEAAKARAEIRERVGRPTPNESAPATERSRWFFPIGKELPLRVEKKKGDIWITTGAGSQGILVPQDGSTSVTLEAKGDGVEVVVGGGNAGGEMHTFTFSPEMGKSTDGKTFFKVEIPAAGDAKVMTRHKDDDEDDDDADDDDDDDDDDHEHGHAEHGMTHGNGIFVLGGKGEGDGEHHEIVVEKGRDLVVPHPPIAGGGGIIINNNGGTVIIGDSAIKLRAGHGGEKRIDVLMKDGDADAKMKTLKALGYIGEKAEKAEKKAKKAEKKKDSN